MVLAAVSSGTARAQPAGPVQTEVLRDWVAMKDRVMKIADGMPEAKFDYKSTPAHYAADVEHRDVPVIVREFLARTGAGS